MQSSRSRELGVQNSYASLSSPHGISKQSRFETDEYLQRLLEGKRLGQARLADTARSRQHLQPGASTVTPFATAVGQRQPSSTNQEAAPGRGNDKRLGPELASLPSHPSAGLHLVRQPNGYTAAPQQTAPGRPSFRPAGSTAVSSKLHNDPAAASSTMKNLLGQEMFQQMRGLVISQEDTFKQQLWDLHRLVQRQQYLSAVCEDAGRLPAEVNSLQAELQARKRAKGMYQARKRTAAEPQHRHTTAALPVPAMKRDSIAGVGQSEHEHARHMLSQPGPQFRHDAFPGAAQLKSPADLAADMQAETRHAGSSRSQPHGAEHHTARSLSAQRDSVAQWQGPAVPMPGTSKLRVQPGMQHANANDRMQARHNTDRNRQEEAATHPPVEAHDSMPVQATTQHAADSRMREHTEAGSAQQNAETGNMQRAKRDAPARHGIRDELGARGPQQSMGQPGEQPQQSDSYGPQSNFRQVRGFGSQGSRFHQNMQSNAMGAYGAFLNMCNPYAAMQSDPMAAWYATHYGRMACAAAAGAAAATAAAQQQQGAYDEATNNSNATRWWQDPHQVFGPAATAFANPDNEHGNRTEQRPSRERMASDPNTRPKGSDKPFMGGRPSQGPVQTGGRRHMHESRSEQAVQGGSMERREVTGTTDDYDMTDRSPRERLPKRPRTGPETAGKPAGASAFRRLGSQGAGGMAAAARADSVGSDKSSVVDASAKREETTDRAGPQATSHAPAMRTAASILTSLSSP